MREIVTDKVNVYKIKKVLITILSGVYDFSGYLNLSMENSSMI